MIISASYHYPMANVTGAAAFALALGLLFTPLIGGWLWIGSQNLWLFIGLFTVFFIVITSYSIHYTKLYDLQAGGCQRKLLVWGESLLKI